MWGAGKYVVKYVEMKKKLRYKAFLTFSPLHKMFSQSSNSDRDCIFEDFLRFKLSEPFRGRRSWLGGCSIDFDEVSTQLAA